MAADISMDYEVVGSLAGNFQDAAETLSQIDQAMETAAEILRASAFMGLIGNFALAQYLDGVRPHLQRIAAACGELNEDLLGAISSLRDGDNSGSQRFVNGGGGTGGSGRNPAAAGIPATGKQADFTKYQDGVDGWETINMNGDFQTSELLDQGNRPSCTIYGAMNLLIENGYNISQADADKLDQEIFKSPIDLDGMYDMMDGKHDEGYDIGQATRILDKYGADYSHGDFETYWGLGSPERGDAEKFLIKNVEAGNPVYVTTEINETFGMGEGGHAYTVVGVQKDANGKLQNVLVATNWGGKENAYEIPAKRFMDDWMEWNDGEYIVVNKK